MDQQNAPSLSEEIQTIQEVWKQNIKRLKGKTSHLEGQSFATRERN